MNVDTRKVTNCKVANIRPKYNNLREWMNDPANVYIGRAGVIFIDGERFPKVASEFCNPYKIGKDGDRIAVLEKYKKYIDGKMNDAEWVERLVALYGKTLGCWCVPESCHGDILIEKIRLLKCV